MPIFIRNDAIGQGAQLAANVGQFRTQQELQAAALRNQQMQLQQQQFGLQSQQAVDDANYRRAAMANSVSQFGQTFGLDQQRFQDTSGLQHQAADLNQQQFQASLANQQFDQGFRTKTFDEQMREFNATLADRQNQFGQEQAFRNTQLQYQYANQQSQDQARIAAAQAAAQARQYGADQSAGARMYGADQSLAGRMYGADQSLAGRQYSADMGYAGQTYGADMRYALGQDQINGQNQRASNNLDFRYQQLGQQGNQFDQTFGAQQDWRQQQIQMQQQAEQGRNQRQQAMLDFQSGKMRGVNDQQFYHGMMNNVSAELQAVTRQIIRSPYITPAQQQQNAALSQQAAQLQQEMQQWRNAYDGSQRPGYQTQQNPYQVSDLGSMLGNDQWFSPATNPNIPQQQAPLAQPYNYQQEAAPYDQTPAGQFMYPQASGPADPYAPQQYSSAQQGQPYIAADGRQFIPTGQTDDRGVPLYMAIA